MRKQPHRLLIYGRAYGAQCEIVSIPAQFPEADEMPLGFKLPEDPEWVAARIKKVRER